MEPNNDVEQEYSIVLRREYPSLLAINTPSVMTQRSPVPIVPTGFLEHFKVDIRYIHRKRTSLSRPAA